MAAERDNMAAERDNMQSETNTAMSNFALEQRVYHGKTFEFFKDPPTILSARDEAICLPFGIEVEGRFTARPVFAGGTDTRNHLAVQIAVGSETAAAMRRAAAGAREERVRQRAHAPCPCGCSRATSRARTTTRDCRRHASGPPEARKPPQWRTEL